MHADFPLKSSILHYAIKNSRCHRQTHKWIINHQPTLLLTAVCSPLLNLPGAERMKWFDPLHFNYVYCNTPLCTILFVVLVSVVLATVVQITIVLVTVILINIVLATVVLIIVVMVTVNLINIVLATVDLISVVRITVILIFVILINTVLVIVVLGTVILINVVLVSVVLATSFSSHVESDGCSIFVDGTCQVATVVPFEFQLDRLSWIHYKSTCQYRWCIQVYPSEKIASALPVLVSKTP